MNEDQLRALVRQVVAERLSGHAASHAHAPAPVAVFDPRSHASHSILRMAPSVQKGQPCVIEPHVECALCGFCQSYGH